MLETVSRPLEIANNIPLTNEQIARLCYIEEYDFWFVIERVEQKGEIAPHLIGQAVREFKKYMALIALGHTDIGMSSTEVDEVWHNFILFTREYDEFCRKICGRIIHHRPNTSRRPKLPDGSIADFISAYMKFFGDLPHIWRVQGMRPKPAADILLNGECNTQPAPCSSAKGDCDVEGPCSASLQDCNTGPINCGSSVGDCNTTPSPCSSTV